MEGYSDIEFFAVFWEVVKQKGIRIKSELPRTETGISQNLINLADKIEYMILMHRAKDIKPMLESIVTGKIKVWGDYGDTKGTRNKRREKTKTLYTGILGKLIKGSF